MKLAGLKAVFLGDSITEGSGASSPDKVYWRVLGERTGLIVRGYGVGGTRIARQHSPSANERWDLCFNQRMYDMDKDADIVCVFGGTNDYGHGDAPIGGIDDNTEDTFYGALNHMYSYLVSTYPSSFIFAVTPLHRLNDKRNTGDGYKKPSGSLSDYVGAIRLVAEKYSLPVLDLYANAGLCPDVEASKNLWTADGLHPNDAGYRKIAGIMQAFLENAYYEKI